MVGVVEHPGDEYPGADALSNGGTSACLSRFGQYVGVPYDASELLMFTALPSQVGWLAGDRDIVCFALLPEGELLLGSVAGTSR